MIDFLHSPTYTNFRKLIIAISSLSEAHQRGFFLIKEWRDYKILGLVYDFFEENRGKTCASEEMIMHLCQTCVEVDVKIREYLENNDYNSLIKKGYLEYCTTFSSLMDNESHVLFNVTGEQMNSRAFCKFAIDYIRIFYKSCSEIVWEWGKKHLSLIANEDYYGTNDAIIKILEHSTETDWINGIIQFPIRVQKKHSVYYSDRVNPDTADRFFYLSKAEGSLWKFYSIIPFIGSGIIELQSYVPADVKNSYLNLKEIGNQAAMYGFLICLMSTNYSKDYADLIKDDLIAVSRNALNYSLSSLYETSSVEGIKFIWSLLGNIIDDYRKLITFRRFYMPKLLEGLEKKTLDASRLLELSKEGHAL